MKRTLGKSGIQVSALGMGCWAIGGPWTWAQPGREPFPAGWGQTDDDESIRAIHAALEAGVNFFDTAANYGAGHSERVLGQALKGKRDQVVIATKFGHIINEKEKTVYGDDDQIIPNVRKDVENSLRRLGTDYIDVYQLHAGDYDTVPGAGIARYLGRPGCAGQDPLVRLEHGPGRPRPRFCGGRALHLHPVSSQCHLRQPRNAPIVRGL